MLRELHQELQIISYKRGKSFKATLVRANSKGLLNINSLDNVLPLSYNADNLTNFSTNIICMVVPG